VWGMVITPFELQASRLIAVQAYDLLPHFTDGCRRVLLPGTPRSPCCIMHAGRLLPSPLLAVVAVVAVRPPPLQRTTSR